MTLRVSKHSNQPCSVIFVNFYNFLNNDVIVSSLVSTGNCKLRLPTGVFTPPTPTRQNSFVASVSAVCIWHNSMLLVVRSNEMFFANVWHSVTIKVRRQAEFRD